MHYKGHKETIRQDYVVWEQAILVPEIFWHLADTTPDMEGAKVIAAFTRAFAEWAPFLSPIKFVSTSVKAKANILINFAFEGDADLPESFGGDEVLAYAFFPIDNYSEIWFDESERWGSMSTSTRIDLFKVAVHELGHSLGIGHTKAEDDIMLPFYDPNTAVEITLDSSAAIDVLYGEYMETLQPELPPPESEPQPPVPDPVPEPPDSIPERPKGWFWALLALVLAAVVAVRATTT